MLVYRGVSFPVEIRIKSGSARKIEAKAAAEGNPEWLLLYAAPARAIEAKAESGIVFYRGGQHRAVTDISSSDSSRARIEQEAGMASRFAHAVP